MECLDTPSRCVFGFECPEVAGAPPHPRERPSLLRSALSMQLSRSPNSSTQHQPEYSDEVETDEDEEYDDFEEGDQCCTGSASQPGSSSSSSQSLASSAPITIPYKPRRLLYQAAMAPPKPYAVYTSHQLQVQRSQCAPQPGQLHWAPQQQQHQGAQAQGQQHS